jgi:glyoxalase family protein
MPKGEAKRWAPQLFAHGNDPVRMLRELSELGHMLRLRGVAMAVAGDEEQLAVRDELIRLGHQVTEVRDRQYFRSIYFREPGGILYEIATRGPGFTIDEEVSELGTGLKLPSWVEHNRPAIEAALPPIERE